MAKRIFDIVVISIILVIVSPLLLLGAFGVRLSSLGPVLYRARRGGRHGEPFRMLKFRSMHVDSDRGSAITAPGDRRIFPFGALIRKVKIDELPQLVNILKGDMSIVGPRPEDVRIIEEHYTPWMKETLRVRPGVTSPGAIFGYLQGDAYLDPSDPETSYIEQQMPVKLAIERAYLERANFWSDIGVMFVTVGAILRIVLGMEREMSAAQKREAARWCGEDAFETVRPGEPAP